MNNNPRESLARRRARLLEEVAAIDRDIAELDRIAAKYNLDLEAMASEQAQSAGTRARADERPSAASGMTVEDLVNRYQTDDNSSYKDLRFRTREHYRSCLKRILDDCGNSRLSDLKRGDIQRLYASWTGSGESMAHALNAMFRILVNYGSSNLENDDCERLAGILHNIRGVKVVKPRENERLTPEQVAAIIKKAHEKGLHSLALAQAFQFDCMLRQRDVIGEWVPNSEPGVSDVTYSNTKWLRGIRWSEIDGNLILRHITSKRLREVEVNLRNAPLVMTEFARIDSLPKKGPIIIFEETKRPYQAHQFRRVWREVADVAGVPKHIKNMDSRIERAGHDPSEDAEASML
jgi:hypothetical protein